MRKSIIFPVLLTLLALTLAGCSKAEKEEVNSGSIIIGHVTDSHTWHICDYKTKDGNEHAVAINLPIILLDDGHLEVFSSKQFHHGHAVYQGAKHTYALIGGGLVKEEIVCVEDVNSKLTQDQETIEIGEHLYATVKNEVRDGKAPHGMQSLIEMLVLHVKDDIVEPILGHNTRRFLPYLLTLFFFIFFCNILGLIPIFPAGANITGNIAVTAILALITFFITNFNGNKHYWKDVFWTPGVPSWLKIFPLMPIVELVGVFTKPIVLMIRLFANMTAGHIVILGFVVIIFILSNSLGMAVGGAVSAVSVLFAVFISLLECLVAYIQAFVFTMLSALYISMAVETPEEA